MPRARARVSTEQNAAVTSTPDERRATLALVAAALIFGTTFTAVKGAIADVEPIPLNAVRFAIGTAVLLPFAWRRRPTTAARDRRGGRSQAIFAVAGRRRSSRASSPASR